MKDLIDSDAVSLGNKKRKYEILFEAAEQA